MSEQAKKDFIDKCNQTKMPAVKHMELKCNKCRKADCVRAKAAAK